MTKETINTNLYELKPPGHYILEVEKVYKKRIKSKNGSELSIYEWFFDIRQSDADMDNNQLKLGLFKSQLNDLLKGLGMKEMSPGVYELDYEEVVGKKIECNLVHTQDKSGTTRETLIEIKPFLGEIKSKELIAAEKAWDE